MQFGSQFDKRAMTINDIVENDVNSSSMVIGYKIYHSSRENSVFRTIVYVAYEMIKVNKKYDLYEFLQSKLLKNLAKTKQDKRKKFKYGSLILCLFFFSMNEVMGVGHV